MTRIVVTSLARMDSCRAGTRLLLGVVLDKY